MDAMTDDLTDEDRWAVAILQLKNSDQRMRLLLAAAERGYESITQLEAGIRRHNTAAYEAEIERRQNEDQELKFLQDRHAHPQRYAGYPEPYSKRTRETFNGRELKRYDRDGNVTETILCTTGAGLGHITAVY